MIWRLIKQRQTCHETVVTVLECSPHLTPQGLVTKPSLTVWPFLHLWCGLQPLGCLPPCGVWTVEAWAFRGRKSPCGHVGCPGLTPGRSGWAPAGVYDFIKTLLPVPRNPWAQATHWLNPKGREAGIRPSFFLLIAFQTACTPVLFPRDLSSKMRDLVPEVWAQRPGGRAA